MWFDLTLSATALTNILFFLSLCIPAHKEPVPTNTGDCQPLINLTNPFCEYYGVNLDRYVRISAERQEEENNLLWSNLEVLKGLNASFSTECLQQAYFLACHHLFLGCDRSTSVFRPKTFCRESCLSFIHKCNGLAKGWLDINKDFPNPNCSDKPSRSAGNVPECAFYASKVERLKKERILVGRYITGWCNLLLFSKL